MSLGYFVVVVVVVSISEVIDTCKCIFCRLNTCWIYGHEVALDGRLAQLSGHFVLVFRQCA